MFTGIIQLIPAEVLFDPDRGLTHAERTERFLEARYGLDGSLSNSIGDWINIKRAIKSENGFSLDIDRPGDKIWLKFSFKIPDDGEYKITPRVVRGQIETGRTTKVTLLSDENYAEIEKYDKFARFLKIRSYEFRFFMHTTTNEQPGIRKTWIVGLNQIQDTGKPLV